MATDNEKIASLVIAYQNGDKNAFNEIYTLTKEKALYTAERIIGNKDDAEDIVQEAYITLCEKINTLNKPESFVSWFNMIVANKAKTEKQKINKKFFLLDYRENDEGEDYPDVFESIEDEDYNYQPGYQIEKDELRKDVMSLVDTLGDEKKTSVLLYYYDELTTKQIAESLEVNENTVKSRLVQARKDLNKGMPELEKKHGKLLSVSPIPLVIWAFKCSSAATITAFTESGASAATLAAITAKVAKTAAGTAGTATAKATGLSLTQKIIAGTVAVSIAGTGAIVGTRLIKNKEATKNETTITATETYKEKVAETKFEIKEDPTLAKGKLVDSKINIGSGKYGVNYLEQDFAVKKGEGSTVVRGAKTLNRKNYSANYNDLLPAANENRERYLTAINSIFSSLNAKRVAGASDNLTLDSQLTEGANVRAEEIAWSARNYSIRPDGSSYTTIFDRNGYVSGTREEIRAFGVRDADEAAKIILKDKTVLNPKIEKIGIGVAENPESGKLVFVVHLYGSEGSDSENSAEKIERLLSKKDDTIDNAQDGIEKAILSLETLREEIRQIPVLGPVLLFDWPTDWLTMGISLTTDKIVAFLRDIFDMISNYY